MANPTIARVVYSFVDGRGKYARPQAKRAAAEIAAIKGAADILAAPLIAASDCSMLGYTINYAYTVDTPIVPGVAPVSAQMMLTFDCADGSVYVFTLPGINSDLVGPDVPLVEIDINQPSVQLIAEAIISNGYISPTGAALVAVVSASLAFVP